MHTDHKLLDEPAGAGSANDAVLVERPKKSAGLALEAVIRELDGVDAEDVARILSWVADLHGLAPPSARKSVIVERESKERTGGGNPPAAETEFPTFDRLFEVLNPTSDVHKALTAAYWLGKDCETTFTGGQINDLLKPQGHGIGNVTNALGSLTSGKPTFVIQVGKNPGKQGHKTFRLTKAGKTELERRIQAAGTESGE